MTDLLTFANQIACHIPGAKVVGPPVSTQITILFDFRYGGARAEGYVKIDVVDLKRAIITRHRGTDSRTGEVMSLPFTAWHDVGQVKYGAKTPRGIAKTMMRRVSHGKPRL